MEGERLLEGDAAAVQEHARETTPLFGEKHKEHLLSPNGPIPRTNSVNNAEQSKTRKRLAFAAFALQYFTMTASYSVIAPFFPTEAKAKGAGTFVIGLIFGIFAFTTFITAPIIGILIPKVGVRFFLFAGIFVIGVAEGLFGLLNRMPDGTIFIVFAMVLRVVDGTGGAAAMTSAVSCVTQLFPENVAFVMGMLELFTGLGLMFGPLIGGVLYEYGGFGMPFFVLAGLIIITLPFIACILPPIESPTDEGNTSEQEQTNNLTTIKFFSMPSICIFMFATVLGGMAIGIVEPTLAIHLKKEFGITSSTRVGFVFFALCAGYAISAPLFGYISDKTDGYAVMTAGCFTLGISYFLLGPVPLSFMPKSLTMIYVAISICGVSLGPFFAPAIAVMEKTVKQKGYPDNMTTHGLVSGYFASAFNVGSFVGPTFSGAISEYVTFPWLCTFFAVLLILEALMLLVLTIINRINRKSMEDEAPLLTNTQNI